MKRYLFSFLVCSLVLCQLGAAERKMTDKIDYPFTNDYRLLSQSWCSFDFVNSIDEFKAEKKTAHNISQITKIIFEAKGELCWEVEKKKCAKGETLAFAKWTKIPYTQYNTNFDGVIIHKGDLTASGYLIKRIGKEDYLFIQHKSGDYVFDGKKPALRVYAPCTAEKK